MGAGNLHRGTTRIFLNFTDQDLMGQHIDPGLISEATGPVYYEFRK